MASYLTTRQVQEILQVDRTTIYRMADSGRIPAVKVGNQWRFPQSQVAAWLAMKSGTVATENEFGPERESEDVRRLIPVDCVQQIQDAFADALGVMIVVTDLEGRPLLRVSNPCGLYDLAEGSPNAHRRCIESWAVMARNPSMHPAFMESPLGLLCARGLIRIGSRLCAMLVVGGIAPQQWPPSASKLASISDFSQIDAALLEQYLDRVHYVGESAQARLLPFVQRIADILAHIITERKQLFDKLDSISQLSQV